MKSIGVRPELLRLMLRRLGKRYGSVSSESPTDFTWLLARTRVLRPGYMAPSFLTSAQSCSWLSVICSRRSDGQEVRASDTELKPFRHRKSSSSLDGEVKGISTRRNNSFQATSEEKPHLLRHVPCEHVHGVPADVRVNEDEFADPAEDLGGGGHQLDAAQRVHAQIEEIQVGDVGHDGADLGNHEQ